MSVLYAGVVSTIETQQIIEAEIRVSEVGPTVMTQIRRDLQAVKAELTAK